LVGGGGGDGLAVGVGVGVALVEVLGTTFGLASLLHPPMAVAASAPTARAAVTRTENLATVFDPAVLTSTPLLMGHRFDGPVGAK
jgi:hypothetical protein